MRTSAALTVLALAGLSTIGFSDAACGRDDDPTAFFEAKIRPVLIKHCYECHSAESKTVQGGLRVDSAAGLRRGGDSGPSVVEQKPDESLLLEAIRFESFEMPPSGKLPDEVIKDFERWIAMGAPDPREETPLVPKTAYQGMTVEEGRSFWAFQPVEPHGIPTVANTEWPRTWIDRFVLQRLEDSKLTPQPDTDRATLLRRLSFDLTGLPPSEEDLRTLLHSGDPKWLESYVDRLLDSPHFGEHWGRHWLDVARYADSNGADFNATFHEAWRYRNYVIDSYNADRPFNELIVEQVAGDLLPWDSDAVRERQLVATGFLMLGTKMLSERDKEKLRMDVVDEQVSTIGSAFLGMTLGCARCHDHKFDPIPTSDYYALAGILRSTQTLDGEFQQYVSNWVRQPLPMTPAHEAALTKHRLQADELRRQVKTLEEEVASLSASSALESLLKTGILLDDTQAEVTGQWKESTYSKLFVGKGYIHDDRQEKGEKKVVFRTKLPATGEYEVRFAYPGSGGRSINTPVTIVHADGETTIPVNQSEAAPIERLFKPLGTFRFSADTEAVVTVSNAGTEGYVIVDAVQFVPKGETAQPMPSEDPAVAKKLDGARKALDQLKATLKKHLAAAPPPAPLALAVNEASDRGDCNICIRGETGNLGSKVSRGFLSVALFDDPPQIGAEESGRLALAQWIADERNPLTARVYVNRIWQHLLGEGIVRSVDNFGTLGQRPTHLDLLDQLAVEFIDHGWSTKWLIRQIVLSRVYQLSSTNDDAKWSADPENHSLWRANRKRLTAESLRDTMLLAAGELDLSQPESPVEGFGILVSRNTADDESTAAAETSVRTIYQAVIRSELPSLMRVFDFADPDFATGQRPQTNVPAQALWMLNGHFVTERSSHIAARLLARNLPTDRDRIETLYLLTLGRPPSADESRIAQTFLDDACQKNDDAASRHAAWADLTHALFASTSFRMLD